MSNVKYSRLTEIFISFPKYIDLNTVVSTDFVRKLVLNFFSQSFMYCHKEKVNVNSFQKLIIVGKIGHAQFKDV